MQNWYHIFPKNTGLSAFAWLVFCLLPFYFIFRSTSLVETLLGIVLILLFFATYRLSFIKKGWTVYVSVSIEIAISIGMILYFGYVYFSLFLAFYIGNIESKAGFLVLYIVNLVTTVSAVSVGFLMQSPQFIAQTPFIVISIVGVILLPLTLNSRNKRERLERKLEDANKKISRLMVIEERQRIARDLHDTLGQKLSLIGLKSDLAGKIIERDPETAKKEVEDINQTARMALKEVREMVSDMKNAKLKDEVIHARHILEAAGISFQFNREDTKNELPLLVENVLGMCLKEAVTNVVKHSKATVCQVEISNTPSEQVLIIQDNGIGAIETGEVKIGNGLQGIRERLDFVNGNLSIDTANGTTLTIKIPKVIQQKGKEGLK
ncbi:sensor histidine kinase DesK [Oceanobacillus picturae]|uniref:histidine kinase n=1 Tax=Oceanobacillus picturae TaxID=171693 RepID=A0A0U9HA84_9BACI|nr:sensor histidine kinase [Oceanobacillus picturae]RIU92714.1 sensor histidine kinase [Oceanobacillus picturae]GAQ17044.1 sensor histidine kinase DesK [Oceanobacillus picturae]